MGTALSGHTILVVEDEPLIALEMACGFERAGAHVAVARSLADAREIVERDGICAAVLDFGLGDGNADEICQRLAQKHVPFVLHSGYEHTGIASAPAAVIPKPTSGDKLVDAVCQVLRSQQ